MVKCGFSIATSNRNIKSIQIKLQAIFDEEDRQVGVVFSGIKSDEESRRMAAKYPEARLSLF